MKNTSRTKLLNSHDAPALLDLLESAEHVLARTGELREHFLEDLTWMETRRQAWRTRAWRVGLIGITSSGKSTLVNALLGQRLLPSAVRPSSNTLVVCRRGPEHHALIHYQDGRTERVTEDLGPRLSFVCDEKTNPDNEQGIKEIEVFSPTFLLGEDVALVDTPGLDATDAHERLTLVEFLPTVDMVVFLTTAKASSDGAVAGYLERISSEGKPLVLVQNMIDAIEPKLGPGGVVQRSRAEVAGDHLQRLRRLVRTALGEPGGAAVPILQVSAFESLRGNMGASNIPDLVGAIGQHLRALEPALVIGRCEQLARHLQRIIRRESTTGALAPGRTYASDEQAAISAARQRLDALGKVFHRKLETLREDTRKAASRFERQAASLSEEDVSSAEELAQQVDAWHVRTADSVIAALDEASKALRELAQELNLRPDDYLLKAPQGASRRTLHVPTETRSMTVREKKKGFLPMVARFFGSDSGYNIETRYSTIVEVATLRARLAEFTQKEVGWLENNATRLRQSILAQQHGLQQELERRQRALEQLQRSAAKNEERHQAAEALVPLCERLEEEVRKARPAPPANVVGGNGVEETAVVYETAPHVLAVLQLARHLSRRRFLAAREHCLARIGDRRPEVRHRVLLWAWDPDVLGRFVQRFWYDLLPPVPEDFSGVLLETRPRQPLLEEALLCVHAEGRTPEAELQQATASFLRKPATTFLLIDIEQPGAAQRMLRRSPLVRSFGQTQGLVLVPQSLQGVLHAQTLAEALLELRGFAESFPVPVDGVLANHDSVALSYLADRLFLEGELLRTLADEQEWLAGLRDHDLPAGFEAAPVLRAWREAMTPSSNPRATP
ncbi:dynamin family protein [Archangium violaceum]|uniref:dynamin family protein n=1 Tax=Archangium violaceum TaxID=83451 RepID=UPI00193BDEAC|nr:dynamin family protein [Archangium violaceum]QRK05274.1 dynamin family protein [Archangium violaceum]